MKNRFEIKGSIAEILLERKGGSTMKTIINSDDLWIAQGFNGMWKAALNRRRFNGRWGEVTDSEGGTFYVQGDSIDNKGKNELLLLHRLITNCPADLVVDHKDHNTMNNTRNNLRNVTEAVNSQNRVRGVNNRSGYKNVSWNTNTKKWKVAVMVNGKRVHFGYFSDVKQAGEAARKARISLIPNYVNICDMGIR